MFDYNLYLVQFITVKFGKANHLVFLDEMMVLNEKIFKTFIIPSCFSPFSREVAYYLEPFKLHVL